MTRFESAALVLGTRPEGESDLAVGLFTPEGGRIEALAKGALRSKKRFVGALDLVHLIEAGFVTSPRGGRLILEHARLIDGFPEFRKDPRRLARACLLLEIIGMAAPAQEPSPAAFHALLSGLLRLRREPDSDRWAAAYSFRLLKELGYEPRVAGCVACGQSALERGCRFDASLGGGLCEECRAKEKGRQVPVGMERGLSPDTSRTLSWVMEADESVLARVNFTRNSLAQSMDILSPFIAFHLGAPSNSLKLLEGQWSL